MPGLRESERAEVKLDRVRKLDALPLCRPKCHQKPYELINGLWVISQSRGQKSHMFRNCLSTHCEPTRLEHRQSLNGYFLAVESHLNSSRGSEIWSSEPAYAQSTL